MTFKFTGLGDFEKQLTELSQNAQAVSGEHQYSFNEIFTSDFMRQHTNHETIEDFLTDSPEKISNTEDFEKASDEILDNFVNEQTDFKTWEDMLATASQELIARKLGF